MFGLLYSLTMFVIDFFQSPRRLEAENLFLRPEACAASSSTARQWPRPAGLDDGDPSSSRSYVGATRRRQICMVNGM